MVVVGEKGRKVHTRTQTVPFSTPDRPTDWIKPKQIELSHTYTRADTQVEEKKKQASSKKGRTKHDTNKHRSAPIWFPPSHGSIK